MSLNVAVSARAFAEYRRELMGSFLSRPNTADEIVQLHPIRACRAADELEGLLEIEAVALRDDPLGLLDRNPGLQRMLELGPALVRRLRDCEQPAHCGSRFFGRAAGQ